VDLTLRDGVNLQHAIQMAKRLINKVSRVGLIKGFRSNGRQGFANAQFEVNSEDWI
jgi:hypothetical protein